MVQEGGLLFPVEREGGGGEMKRSGQWCVLEVDVLKWNSHNKV
jgi:hypothetical protein